jgi:hypothetical protein
MSLTTIAAWILSLLGTGVVSTVVTHYINRSKYKTEVKSSEIDNIRKSIDT